MIDLDRMYCASKGCKNKCNRRLDTEQMIYAFEHDMLIEYVDFCDENGELIGEPNAQN